MAYGDRMTLKVKEFGRRIEIRVQRGTITRCSETMAIIEYHDSPVRNLPRGERARKKRRNQ
jgi:hypothetical protein